MYCQKRFQCADHSLIGDREFQFWTEKNESFRESSLIPFVYDGIVACVSITGRIALAGAQVHNIGFETGPYLLIAYLINSALETPDVCFQEISSILVLMVLQLYQ